MNSAFYPSSMRPFLQILHNKSHNHSAASTQALARPKLYIYIHSLASIYIQPSGSGTMCAQPKTANPHTKYNVMPNRGKNKQTTSRGEIDALICGGCLSASPIWSTSSIRKEDTPNPPYLHPLLNRCGRKHRDIT